MAIPADRNVMQKETKTHDLMHSDTANVEHEMCDYTGNNWNHQNCSKRFKEKSGSHITKTFNRFTHNAENTSVRNLKPERREKYQGEKAC